MDNYSFLNTAHTSYFEEQYDRYLKAPDTVEPSWRAFFQGFDFGIERGADILENEEVPESVRKELDREDREARDERQGFTIVARLP